MTLSHADSRAPENRTGPAPRQVCGARSYVTPDDAVTHGDRSRREAQTAAGSSSTRRLRVRFGSTGMPGPIVVERAAFLM